MSEAKYLKRKIIRLAYTQPHLRPQLLPLLKTGTTNEQEWPRIFDSLKKGDKVMVGFTSVMGSSELTSGKPYEWIVGRRSRSKRTGYEALALIQPGQPRLKGYRLVKWVRQGQPVSVSAASGDMGLFLQSLRKV